MAIGLIIIGDEILSGKRADKHFPKVVSLLSARGLQLGWAEYIGDERARITATLARTMATGDIVFSCGGIGATPDDHTRQCAAAAYGTPLIQHPEAKALIEGRMIEMARESGTELNLSAPENLHRLHMGEFPAGSSIIPNPFNKIPGFSLLTGDGGAHYFVPGFPVMAWPMIEWVLDTHYSHLFHQVPRLEKAALVYGSMESTLTPLMEQIESQYPLVKVFSLPSVGDAETRRHIELGVKGEPEQATAAFAQMMATLDQMTVEYVLLTTPSNLPAG
ncbi:competence/damage-inducible protein A [Actimicrobium sp. CCI2.3]|uniref:competence/damage-inducible protein A n=1 Tax=Actimicrobium sp. CCI2.3 TaxID=3048616 RepID=UPI002AB40CF0|nr:molybdopterin-binding protein [Actimicrobium sp. CCI2.3]MDY7575659.1 molybdopterin-binding protein [Actimicrobium sp. CCI2.3]MEB0021970.1 molybdopterin-binding protein [Actimicrobium sp. CCI2.3]